MIIQSKCWSEKISICSKSYCFLWKKCSKGRKRNSTWTYCCFHFIQNYVSIDILFRVPFPFNQKPSQVFKMVHYLRSNVECVGSYTNWQETLFTLVRSGWMNRITCNLRWFCSNNQKRKKVLALLSKFCGKREYIHMTTEDYRISRKWSQ